MVTALAGQQLQWINLKNYPATHWGFNFWDHGAAQYGVCFDDSTLNESEGIVLADGLEIEEIIPVFENAEISKWDLISFDCCLMNMVEWVYEFEDLCDYFVASQESIPGQGFLQAGSSSETRPPS